MTTQISTLLSTSVSMNSKEISELVELRHDNVKRTIKTLAEQGAVIPPQIGVVPFVDESGRNRTVEAYVFSGEQGKRDSIIVVAQLSPQFTARLVDRWMELEQVQARVPQLQGPLAQAEGTLQAALNIAKMLQVPDHLAYEVAVDQVKVYTGTDLKPFLSKSSAKDNIKEEEMMLEPRDLAKRFGIKFSTGLPDGGWVNRILQHHGYQEKVESHWQPTEEGKKFCIIHHWDSEYGSKTGYNLKWSVKLFESLIN